MANQTTPSGIVWADPPRRQTEGIFTPEIRAALRERPGEWARIAQDVTASNVTSNKRRHPGFEFTSRGNAKHVDLYARYIGENGEHR